MDVVVISDANRPALLTQTIATLTRNAGIGVNVHLEMAQFRGVGETKNAGAKRIKRTGKWVLFSDDDMYWLKDYAVVLRKVMEDYDYVTQLGAWSHPYNLVTDLERKQPLAQHSVGEVSAAHGGGFVMSWDDWDKYGPFDATGHGPGQSEDWALSQKIKNGGGFVKCIYPYAALHCGITNCQGKPATGADALQDLVRYQIRKEGLNDVVYM